VQVEDALGAALQVIEREVPKLKTGFRVAAVEALAVLWPGVETDARPDERIGAVGAKEDFLE
jgi:hypothetical protein